MPIRTRASYDEGEANRAAAVPPPPPRPLRPPPPPRPPSMNDYEPQRQEAQETLEANEGEENDDDDEEEEWRINTNEDEGDEEEDDEELIFGHKTEEAAHRPTWILQVEVPETNNSADRDDLEKAHVFIDPGMTAERLGRCILQVVSPAPEYNRDYHDFSSNQRSGLAGLFGKGDGVFYSLEFILSMDPLDGSNRTFCVAKPVRRKVATKDRTSDTNWSAMIATYTTIGNLGVATSILFLAIFLARDWGAFMYSLIVLIPQDLPSWWRTVSYILDWPAREVYRYGPSVVGWEGRDMIDICTQMNRRYYFLGPGSDGQKYEDREYWRHNLQACETIYRMNEERFARMCRPIWYLLVLFVSFLAIQRLVEKMTRPSGPLLDRSDRAVLDLYRALQNLSREHKRQDDRWQQQQMSGR